MHLSKQYWPAAINLADLYRSLGRDSDSGCDTHSDINDSTLIERIVHPTLSELIEACPKQLGAATFQPSLVLTLRRDNLMPRIGARCTHRFLLTKLCIIIHNFTHQLFDHILADAAVLSGSQSASLFNASFKERRMGQSKSLRSRNRKR